MVEWGSQRDGLGGVDHDRLSKDIRLREWGGIARNKIRLVGFDRRYMFRRCSECGELLRTYDGTDDAIGNYVRYIQDVQVACFAHHFDRVYGAYLRYKTDLKREDMTIADYAALIPLAVSDDELGLPMNNDLRAPGPFADGEQWRLQRKLSRRPRRRRHSCS